MDETHGLLAALRRTSRMGALTAMTASMLATTTLTERVTGQTTRDDALDGWKRLWARSARAILGLDATIVAGQRPSLEPRARLVVSNHRTPLDIVTLMGLFDGGHFLANHKTRTAPVVGMVAHKVGTIFVDRDDRQSGAQAVRAMRRLLEAKRTVIVFPEGTTHRGDEVRPFKGGAFVAASGLDVEVVPVGLAYPEGTEFAEGESLSDHASRFLSRARTPTWVSIGEPRPFPARRRGVEDELRGVVQALVDQARRGSAPTP